MDRGHSWKIGAEMLPNFVVARELGRGGMGAVLLVEYRPTGQQYAVKTAILSDTKARQQFMAELRRWHELPSNPHLVRCYFSREIENRVHVFAEYVRGGSLDQWIRAGWISTVPEMLDVAIQLARALQTLHDQDLLHQDVKPQNVLIADDGKVKLTDFGLAQTTEYRSPEQACLGKVDKATDQWSWALTVLFMFSGERTWVAGETGAFAFDDYVANIEENPLVRPRMPDSLLAILRRALEEDSAQRWPNMSSIADALAKVYKEVTNSVHIIGSLASRARDFAAIVAKSGLPDNSEKRSIGVSEQWRDEASSYLQSRSVGAELEAVLGVIVEGQSREAQTVEQLRRFDEVQRQAEERWNSNNQDLSALEALLGAYEKKAALHHRNGDLRKAIEYLQRAAESIDQGGKSVKPAHLETQANAYRRRGLLLAELGEYKAALESLEQARLISNKLQEVVPNAWHEQIVRAALLAVRVRASMGFILLQAGQADRALDELERATSYATDSLLVAVPALLTEVAQIHTRRGLLLRAKGKFDDAHAAFQNAAARLEKAPGAEHFLHQEQLANVKMWQGLLQTDRGDLAQAKGLLLRSIEIRKDRVLPHAPFLARIGLAQCGEVLGSIAVSQRQWKEADEFFAPATFAWDRIVHEHGRSEYVDRLAVAIWRELDVRNRLKMPLGDKLPMARRLFEHLVQRQGRKDLAKYLDLVDSLQSAEGNDSKISQSSWVKPSLTEEEAEDAKVLAAIAALDGQIGSSQNLTTGWDQSWVAPNNLNAPTPALESPSTTFSENSSSNETKSLISFEYRTRFVPALSLALFLVIFLGVVRLYVQSLVITNIVFMLVAPFLLYFAYVASDGFFRGMRDVPYYRLTPEDFDWTDSDSSDPMHLSLRRITKIELTADQHLLLTSSGRKEPYRITSLGNPSFSEKLIRPTSAGELFDALRMQMQNANPNAMFIDARKTERRN